MAIVKLGNSTTLTIDISPKLNIEMPKDIESIKISKLIEELSINGSIAPTVDSINADFNWLIKRGEDKWEDDVNLKNETFVTPINIKKSGDKTFEIEFLKDAPNPIDVLRMGLYNKGSIGFNIAPSVTGNQTYKFTKENVFLYDNQINVEFTPGENLSIGSEIPFKLSVSPIFKNLIVALSIYEKGKYDKSASKVWEIGSDGIEINDVWNLGFGFDSESDILIYGNEIDSDQKLEFYYSIDLIKENEETNKKDDNTPLFYSVCNNSVLSVDQPKLSKFELSFDNQNAKVNGLITGFNSSSEIITHVDLYEKVLIDDDDKFIHVASMLDSSSIDSNAQSSDEEKSASAQGSSSASLPEESSSSTSEPANQEGSSSAELPDSTEEASAETETKSAASADVLEGSTSIKISKDGSINAYYPIKLIKDATKEKQYFAVLHLNDGHSITGSIPVFGYCIYYLPNMVGKTNDNLGFAPFLIGEGNTSELSVEEKATGVCTDLKTIANIKEELESDAKFKGGFKEYAKAVAVRESGDDYGNDKSKSGYLGRYQFGLARLMDLSDMTSRKNPKGKGDENYLFKWNAGYSKNAFLTDPALQDRMFKKHIKLHAKYIKKHYSKYIGEKRTLAQAYKPKAESLKGITLSEVELTLSGLVQGLHLKGYGGLRSFLTKNDDNADGLGTRISEYIYLFGHYDISEVLDED